MPAWMPSSVYSPRSNRSARRSRAVSAPFECWRAIFASPPPSLAFSRRSRRSSTRGRRMEVGCSVEAMWQHRIEDLGDPRRTVGRGERGDLDADDLAGVGDGVEEVEELLLRQAPLRGELGGHELGVEDVAVEVDVGRRAVERALEEHQCLE